MKRIKDMFFSYYLGLIRSNIVKTPRVKLIVTKADAIENSPILEVEHETLFRSGTMRCAYLALDRVYISEAVKSLARAMSKPRAGHVTQLKRVARYLKGVPCRAHLDVHVDSDWAGDIVTRQKHVWSDRGTWTTLAQTQLNSATRDWCQ